MKPQSIVFIIAIAVATILTTSHTATAQQYKMRQVSTMTGMKSETTIYVKGARKRTEGGGYMGIGGNIVTIEQCDLQRTIKINDNKKLYYIEPFVNITEEEEETKPAPRTKPVPAVNKEKEKEKLTGGVITTYYNITDTGERKKMYGFTARHVWTTQKIKPSADACMMKDSMIIKTDGWYIDLPQFNCPITGYGKGGGYGGTQKVECKDRFVSKRSGKGRLGFALIETKTMFMGGTSQTTEFKTDLETLEFSTAKLDSMLFEIPIGYAETKNEEDLQDKIDPMAYIQQAKQYSQEKPAVTEEKSSGMIRIGVYEPTGEESLQVAVLQKHLVNTLRTDKIEAIAVASQEDAEKFKCDYVLMTEFTRVKQGSKVGGLLKALKNTDPSAVTSFNIEANLSLLTFPDGAEKAKEKVDGKFEGKADEAAKKALEKGSSGLLKDIR
jgi:hypothetical protein